MLSSVRFTKKAFLIKRFATVPLNPTWSALAAKEIGGDPNTLVKNIDSLTVKPLYTKDDYSKEYVLIRFYNFCI
jgi:hypothetical protein